MRHIMPNKISRSSRSALLSPLRAAIINMRLGRADSDDYHHLAAAMMIGYRAAEIVARHRHLLPEIQPSLNALSAVYERQQQRTVDDAPYSGTADEVDAIENGVTIYQGIIAATPGKAMRSAINRATRDLG